MLDASKDSTNDAVVILAVSTILGKENSIPIGSLMGGTTLYMKVLGLDQTASNNAVYVGKYPCIISDKGVNGLFVNCKTTKSNQNDHNLLNLKIMVKVQDKPDSICTFSYTYCHFSYTPQNTPKLFYVTPRSNYPRMFSYWRAKWVISSNAVEYLEGQFMGSNRCDRFSIQDLYPKQINYQDDKVVCQVSAEIQAGYYDYTIKSQNGYQINSFGLKQKKVYSDRMYNSKVVPIITGLNTNFASPEGQILEIFGFGFSPFAHQNRVKISGQSESIEVITSTPTSIKVKIPKIQKQLENSIYIQGSGLHYTRWNISGLNYNCGSFRQQIITNMAQLDERIKFDGIYPEPDVQSTFGEQYGQYFRGFLKAPFTGVYRFYISSDNCAQFYIQKTEIFKPIRPDNPIAASNWNPYRNYWFESLSYTSAIKSISQPITLEADNFYYIEVYHINEISEGHLTLSMEIESETIKSNSLNSIYQIQTTYTPIKEVIEFTLYNQNENTLLKGNYRLRFTYGIQKTPQIDTFYIYTSSELTASSSANAMKNAIQSSGAPYYITVISTKLDYNGNTLDDSVISFAGYKYTITFDSHRGSQMYRALPKIVQQTLNGGIIGSTVECIQEPADPISGSFQLSMIINGQETLFQVTDNDYDLKFDVSTTIIANNIEKLTGQSPFVWTVGQPQDGQKWFIVFRTHFEGLYDFRVSNNLLVSGNIIENEFILAGCQKQSICDLTLGDQKTPTLQSYSISGSLLSLSLQEGVDLTITTINIDIEYAGADCTNIQIINYASPYTIICNLEQLNGLNIKEAGEKQIPIIHHKDIGFSKIDQSIIGENVDLQISSIQPNSASSDGGTTITINGMGFPKNLNRDFIFQIDNQNIKPLSISNTQLIFIAPKQLSGGIGSISLQFNSKIATSLFTYDESLRIQVTSLQFYQKSPLFKGDMTITGVNFGNIIEDIKVTLIGNKSYNVKVLSITDTQIKVYLRGGMPGNYRIIVTRKNYGDSYANNDDNLFQYIIPINSVTLEDGTSQAKGSEAGGTVIKITGSNFVQGETLVFIGKAVNWICEIDETRFTSEIIYCTVPNFILKNHNQQQLHYKQHLNQLVQIVLIIVNLHMIMNQVVFKGPITQTATTNLIDNTFTYTIPNLPQGYYTTYILTENGYADKIWISIIELSITTIDNAAIGGQILTINGIDFNVNQHPNVKIGSTICTELQVISSVQIKCRMTRQSGTSAIVTLTQLPSENNSATPYTVEFTLSIKSQQNSPVITSINGVVYNINKKANVVQTGNVVLVFSGSMLNGSSVLVILEYMSNKISGVVSELSDTAVTSTFTDIPAGVYSINILIDNNYAYFIDLTQQTLIVNTDIPISNNPTISYVGGAIITFTGKGFDQNTHFTSVLLCGFNCPITQASYTTLSCETPKLLTKSNLLDTQNHLKYYYQLIDSGSSISTFFDLQQSTYYSSSSASNCFIEVDFGKSRVLKLHQLRYLPRIDIQAIILKGAVFQYTTDSILWQTILTVDQTVHTGWNIYVPAVDISDIKAIRLFDSQGVTGSSCQLAEIELKGWVLSNSNNDYIIPTLCDADIIINGYEIDTISGSAIYSSNSVPIVNTVDPQSGRFSEEAVITISGTGFINGQTTVSIDGVSCNIQSVSETQIIGQTGIKDLDFTQLNGIFQVRVNGNLAVNNQQFIYATKWSDINTWGGYEYPGDGDSVIVNAGQTLIVDVQTPKLMQVLVEGTLTFSDDLDTSMDAHYIIIREGKFNIGTDSIAHQHKVQITLHGNEEDVQMPVMGNKVLGCHQCQLTIHGKERIPTWTLLSTTVQAGTTQIKVDDQYQNAKVYLIIRINEMISFLQIKKFKIINIYNTFECPGLINFLIEDQTGHFFGKVSQAIGNNTYIGPNVTYCTRQEAWNGYWCLGRQITAMGFMSVAPDYNKRLYSPIKLDDGKFFNEINSQMEWHWSGAEPKNLRESKFVALIPSNTIVNMSNAGMNPTASEYQLSKRYLSGRPEDYVILKWQFQVPQVIQVSVGTKVILPGMTTKSQHHNLMNMTDQCGANNYFYQNNTIHFVINGQIGCKVKITLKNTLQISTRLEITTEQFFGDKFLEYARAQLGGDPFNYFIIGIKKSSRRFLDETISHQVTVYWTIVDNVEIGSTDSNYSYQYLEDFATKLEFFNPPPYIGTVLEQSTTINILSNLKFPSTEPTSQIQQTPEATNTNPGNTDFNKNNENNQGSINDNQHNDKEIALTQDEPIYQQKNNENNYNNITGTIKKSIKQTETSSNTVEIVVSVICSVVGVSIIIAALIYYKKIKLAKLIANRNQKVDNEFFKVNLTEQQLQLQNHQQQMD
ncbi:unnamed protein product [Paramecium pentaurelia]|uniref:Fibrocystin-L n=1 Tax=Paramecium pentaurelia TaxID=43138 RepID=A0A8S1VSY6_9CILI|nr:unnamed protein product [Paramecium pentaurelia]